MSTEQTLGALQSACGSGSMQEGTTAVWGGFSHQQQDVLVFHPEYFLVLHVFGEMFVYDNCAMISKRLKNITGQLWIRVKCIVRLFMIQHCKC